MSTSATPRRAPQGLYLHIPYCSALCHYCDFPKTANFQAQHIKNYFDNLSGHLDAWLTNLWDKETITSLNIGGGTPSLFDKEYDKIFETIRPFLSPDCEISLEANPESITESKLKHWQELGFNRVSVGVQTFDPQGLKFLKRGHSPEEALDKVRLTRSFFANTNIDLIYGWQDQSEASFATDLKTALELDVAHLSLYSLTYAAGTPIGRAMQRGKLTPQPEELELSYYQTACRVLANHGYEHDEVSNWARPGFTCRHNWLYWQDGHLLGIGNGAHSYLPQGRFGRRFSYLNSDRKFIQTPPPSQKAIKALELDPEYFAREQRDAEAWLIEYVGSSLRCSKGCDLNLIKEKTGLEMTPSPTVQEGLERNLLRINADHKLHLSAEEWIRETGWALEIIRSFPEL